MEETKMKIEIWSDFACPFCYIGKKRFESALSKFEHKDEVEVIFKAYQLNPDAPKEMKGTAYESFALSHQMSVEDAKKRFDMFTKNAAGSGLVYRYDRIQMTNTFDAHRLAKWANTFGKEQLVTERFMKAYFTDGMNLANKQDLLTLVDELGLSTSEAKQVLETDQFKNEVIDQEQEAKKIGLQGVPFFVVNRQYGISGAQQEDYFMAALEQIWDEEHPNKESTTEMCTDESCSL